MKVVDAQLMSATWWLSSCVSCDATLGVSRYIF